MTATMLRISALFCRANSAQEIRRILLAIALFVYLVTGLIISNSFMIYTVSLDIRSDSSVHEIGILYLAILGRNAVFGSHDLRRQPNCQRNSNDHSFFSLDGTRVNKIILS